MGVTERAPARSISGASPQCEVAPKSADHATGQTIARLKATTQRPTGSLGRSRQASLDVSCSIEQDWAVRIASLLSAARWLLAVAPLIGCSFDFDTSGLVFPCADDAACGDTLGASDTYTGGDATGAGPREPAPLDALGSTRGDDGARIRAGDAADHQPTSCESGRASCVPGNPGVIRLCDARGRERTVACPRGKRCEGGACVPPPCAEGASRCEPNDRIILLCDRGQWRPQACPPGTRCTGGQCTAARGCSPGTQWCEDASAMHCDDQGNVSGLDCAPATCSDGACTPLALDACAQRPKGSAVCAGADPGGIYACSGPNAATKVGECPAWASCAAGSCDVPVCTPGESMCAGAGAVVACAPDGTRWTLVEPCDDAEVCVDGACQPACSDTTGGQVGCAAGGLVACAGGAAAVTSCPGAGVCVAKLGGCVEHPLFFWSNHSGQSQVYVVDLADSSAPPVVVSAGDFAPRQRVAAGMFVAVGPGGGAWLLSAAATGPLALAGWPAGEATAVAWTAGQAPGADPTGMLLAGRWWAVWKAGAQAQGRLISRSLGSGPAVDVTPPEASEVRAVATSDAGGVFVVGRQGDAWAVWRRPTAPASAPWTAVWSLQEPATDVAVSSDERWLALAPADPEGDVVLVDLQAQAAHDAGLPGARDLAFDASGGMLYAATPGAQSDIVAVPVDGSAEPQTVLALPGAQRHPVPE